VAIAGGELKIRNLDFDDRQGDKAVFDYFEKMGVEIQRGREWTTVRSNGKLHGIEVNLNATPDALPALAVAASFAQGKTVIANVEQARIKECDRIEAMCCELRKMGIEVDEYEDGMVVCGGKPKGAKLDGYHDHRIVIALAVAGLAIEGETSISGAEAAEVTYPDFIDDFKKIGADFTTVQQVKTR